MKEQLNQLFAQKLPPVLLLLALLSGGVSYKDGTREVLFWKGSSIEHIPTITNQN